MSPLVYANMLGERLAKHGTEVYLINTGWSGGAYGEGKRMNLDYTRAMVSAAIDGKLADVAYEVDPIFNVLVPTSCPGVPTEILQPKNTWKDGAAYEKQARQLAKLFNENFVRFSSEMLPEIAAAGPRAE